MTWQEERDAELAAFAETIKWPAPYNGPSDPLRWNRTAKLAAVVVALDDLFANVPGDELRHAIADLLAYSEEAR